MTCNKVVDLAPGGDTMVTAGYYNDVSEVAMSTGHDAKRMRLIKELVQPDVVYEIQIVEASPSSWMALAVMKEGLDRRFRYHAGHLYDEASIGDARVS